MSAWLPEEMKPSILNTKLASAALKKARNDKDMVQNDVTKLQENMCKMYKRKFTE